MRKYVFSSTLRDPDWENTVVVSGDVAEEVTRLKERAQGDLIVYGHGQFGQTLCDAGLVDELTLSVVPVFVPDGKTFYRPGQSTTWRLLSVGEAPDPGVAVLTFRPSASSVDRCWPPAGGRGSRTAEPAAAGSGARGQGAPAHRPLARGLVAVRPIPFCPRSSQTL